VIAHPAIVSEDGGRSCVFGCADLMAVLLRLPLDSDPTNL
jgi:hypothetical protein